MNSLFIKQTFLEKFCCSSRKNLWQFFLSFCANVAKCSSHRRKTVKKLKKFTDKTVHSKISFGHIKCSFDEPADSSYRTPKTPPSTSVGRHVFFEEKDNPTENISITPGFLTKVRKLLEKIAKSSFFKKQIFHKNFSYT